MSIVDRGEYRDRLRRPRIERSSAGPAGARRPGREAAKAGTVTPGGRASREEPSTGDELAPGRGPVDRATEPDAVSGIGLQDDVCQ